MDVGIVDHYIKDSKDEKKLQIELDNIGPDNTHKIIPYKIIRDTIHGDINLCKIEVEIIDTKEFQRLRYLRQLGASYFAYPSVNHTRFEHSLGTLFMAQKMVDAVNNNRDKDIIIDSWRELLLIRISALLHDVVYIPFGHTIEDEGSLYESQWNNKKRVTYFLGGESSIGKILSKVDDKFRADVVNFLRYDFDKIEFRQKTRGTQDYYVKYGDKELPWEDREDITAELALGTENILKNKCIVDY